MQKKRMLSEETNIILLQQLINDSDRILLIVDQKGKIITCNQSAEEYLGRRGEISKSQTLGELFTLPSSLEFTLRNTGKIPNSDLLTGEYLLSLGDGESVSINFTAEKIIGSTDELFILTGLHPEKTSISHLSLLNQISQLIISSSTDEFDITTAFIKIGYLLVSAYADYCIFHMVTETGSVERRAIVPEGIINNQAIYDWLENDLKNDEADGLPFVLLEQKAILIPEINPIRRAANAGIYSYLLVPLVSNHKTIGIITLISTDPRRILTQEILIFGENLAMLLTTQIEKSHLAQDRKQMNDALESQSGLGSADLQDTMEHLRQSDELLQTLFRISNRLNATLDIDQILDTLAQEAIQLVNGESGFAGLRIQDAMAVKKYFFQGSEIPFEHTWAVGEGIPGWVLKYKVPYGTSDAQNDPIINKDLAINANVRSIICTPILDSVGEVIAYFDIRNKVDSESFSINDQEMLLTLAPVASIAIQNALAYQQRLTNVLELKKSALAYQELAANLESGREEERTQIARELHDQLGQALTVIKFDLSWLSEQLNQKDETLAQKTKDIILQINSLINSVRQIATGLRPGMLEDLGLVPSIEWQAQDFQKRTGIECNLQISTDDLGLTPEQSLAIFRIFQESLTNVIRYAEAKRVDILITKSNDFFTLQLSDDGKGISSEVLSNNLSFGIMGMQERAKQLGGIFEIKGMPEQGTTIKVTLPIEKVEHI